MASVTGGDPRATERIVWRASSVSAQLEPLGKLGPQGSRPGQLRVPVHASPARAPVVPAAGRQLWSPRGSERTQAACSPSGLVPVAWGPRAHVGGHAKVEGARLVTGWRGRRKEAEGRERGRD